MTPVVSLKESHEHDLFSSEVTLKEQLLCCPCYTESDSRNRDKFILRTPLQLLSVVYQANKLKDCLRDSNPLCSTVH